MDIARDLTNFVLEEKLGQGGFGEVYLAKHLDSGQEIAIKIVQKARLSNWSIQSIKQERNFLVELHTYPWFSKLIFAKDGVNALYFGLKFYAGGDLFHLQLKYGGRLNEDIACFFIAEVLTAVNILHMLGILHRDLKRENILINADGHIVVGDFGISKYLKDNEVAITVVGSPGYIAPEVFTGNGYSYKADLFAVGVIFIEMITA